MHSDNVSPNYNIDIYIFICYIMIVILKDASFSALFFSPESTIRTIRPICKYWWYHASSQPHTCVDVGTGFSPSLFGGILSRVYGRVIGGFFC